MDERDLVVHEPVDVPSAARVELDLDVRGEPVSAALYGKFPEHLRRNVYRGMVGQIPLNPVFGT